VAGATQHQERVSKRADSVRVLVRERGLLDVVSATEKLWSNGRSPHNVRVRDTYIRNRQMPDGPLWTTPSETPELPVGPPVDERRRPAPHILPPLARLLVSQGVAMQFHLTALFVAQCQTRPGGTWKNMIPLSRNSAISAPTWLDLMAVSASAKGEVAQASTYTRNKLRQFRSALKFLSDRNLVDLGRSGVGRRYEGFKLLAEDSSSSGAGVTEYRVPRDEEAHLEVPAHFFTRGWVHVLTKSEIAAYLMWRHLGAASSYAMASWQQRAGIFGLSRDVYDTHQALEAFGLIKVVKPKERRDDGTWRGYTEGAPLYSHRVHVLPSGLAAQSHEVVEKALRKAATLGKWSKPLDV